MNCSTNLFDLAFERCSNSSALFDVHAVVTDVNMSRDTSTTCIYNKWTCVLHRFGTVIVKLI